jgi:hypothetical protein
MSWYKSTDALNQRHDIKRNQKLESDREFLEEVFRERHQEVPAHLLPDEEVLAKGISDVELSAAEMFYLNAFNLLQRDRPPSFSGISYIPWSVINKYAKQTGLKFIDRNMFVNILASFDALVVAYLREKTERNNNKK